MANADASNVVLFIDVDDFKAVNEKAGHLIGDEILRIIFQTVLDIVGGLGDAYRWGGDEIAAFLPGADLTVGERLGQAIRGDVEKQCAAHQKLADARVTTTVSVGVGAVAGRPAADWVTAQVAELMKEVKKNGKNKVLARTLLKGP